MFRWLKAWLAARRVERANREFNRGYRAVLEYAAEGEVPGYATPVFEYDDFDRGWDIAELVKLAARPADV